MLGQLGAELACVLGLFSLCAVPGAERMSLKMDNVLLGWEGGLPIHSWRYQQITGDESDPTAQLITRNAFIYFKSFNYYWVNLCTCVGCPAVNTIKA